MKKEIINEMASCAADTATTFCTGFRNLTVLSGAIALGALAVKCMTDEKEGGETTTEK